MSLNSFEIPCATNGIGIAQPLMTHLVSALLGIYCNVSSPENWPVDKGPDLLGDDLDTYDFIVIGAGSAGSAVARRLAEDPSQKVLLIEAGGDPPVESMFPAFATSLYATPFDWNYPSLPTGRSCLALVDQICTIPKGKMLGGSSALNGALYAKGTPDDFDKWADLGNPGWEWANVMKYFQLMENFPENTTGGPLNIEPYLKNHMDEDVLLQAAVEVGFDTIDNFYQGKIDGFGHLYGTLRNGRRLSTARAYLTEPRSNLHVVKHAVAKQINFNDNKVAESVTFVINDEYQLTVTVGKEVIVSAGSVESPKLLMLSGIGPTEHLNQFGIPVVQDARVGDNFHDHTNVVLFLKASNMGNATQRLDEIYNLWVHNEGPLGSGNLDVVAFLNSQDDSTNIIDIEYMYIAVPDYNLFAQAYSPSIRSGLLRALGPTDRIIAVFVCVENVKSKGTIRLASSDYRDKPIIDHNSLGEEADVETILHGVRRHLEFQNTKAFQEGQLEFLKLEIPECDEELYESDDYWRCYIRYMSAMSNHHVGSVKMGPSSDPTAVVDNRLRVRGVRGVRVVDASIMPQVVVGNTNGPTIMIGEKGADMVKEDWGLETLVKAQ